MQIADLNKSQLRNLKSKLKDNVLSGNYKVDSVLVNIDGYDLYSTEAVDRHLRKLI